MYQTVVGYRSAISRYPIGVGEVPVGVSRNVKRIAKAIFLKVPPIPKYGAVWPASQLVHYLGTSGMVAQLILVTGTSSTCAGHS